MCSKRGMELSDLIDRATPWSSPAALRNIAPVSEVLVPRLPPAGTVLEVASSLGFHAACLAAQTPHLTWQPSALEDEHVTGMEELVAIVNLPNLNTPVQLDATQAWPVGEVDAILNMNMIHIAPWAVAEGLKRGAAKHLKTGGRLFLYGPFKVGGVHTASSNEAFDQSLRLRDPSWGVRDREAVIELAASHGLTFDEAIEMPANNQILVFGRS